MHVPNDEQAHLVRDIAENIDIELRARTIDPLDVFRAPTADAIQNMTREKLLEILCDHSIPAASIIPLGTGHTPIAPLSEEGLEHLEHIMETLDAVCAPPPQERRSTLMQYLQEKYKV